MRRTGPVIDPAFYVRAEWYDRVCSWDPGPELALLRRVTARHGIPRPRRVLEPFCGTGRLLSGWDVPIGFDRCASMLRRGRALGRGAFFRADAAGFALQPATCDLAFSLNDSFRHLLTEADAAAHLRAVARALRPGAAYAIGLELTGGRPADTSYDAWTFPAHGRTWRCRVGPLGDADPASRLETIHVLIHAADEADPKGEAEPPEQKSPEPVIDDLFPMRTYSPRDVEDLIDVEASFELCAVYRDYDPAAQPVEISEADGSAILVLRKEPDTCA